jgi:hypothetical protein
VTRTGAASIALAVILAAAEARADDDGLYGRFDGDVGLRLGAGAALAAGGPMLSVDAGARYLCTAGVYLHYADAVGTGGPRVRRSLAVGVDLAPIFLTRYATNAEHGPAQLDLLLDSLAFGVGAFWDEPRLGPWATTPGVEVSLGLSLPFLPRTSGPYLGLRAALRWRDADLGKPGTGDLIERGALLSLTLGWHQVVRTHLIDPGDGLR